MGDAADGVLGIAPVLGVGRPSALGRHGGSRLGSGVAPRVGDGRPRLASEGGRPSGLGLSLPSVGALPGSLRRARTWGRARGRDGRCCGRGLGNRTRLG